MSAQSPCVFPRIEKQSTGQAGPEINRDLEVLFGWINESGRCFTRIVSYLNSSSSGGFNSGTGEGTSGGTEGGTGQGTGGSSSSRPFMMISSGSSFTLPEGFSGTVYIDATADIDVTLNTAFPSAEITVFAAAASGSGFDITLKDGATTLAVIAPQKYALVVASADSNFAWGWASIPASTIEIYENQVAVTGSPFDGINFNDSASMLATVAAAVWDSGNAVDISFVRAALTGDVTAAENSNATTIANDAVTYAKMQNVSAASRLLGRGDSGSGDPQEIILGTNLSMSGTTLNASGGGGSSATTVETDLGSTAKTNGKFTITDAAIGATSKVLCWQAPGPYTGKGTLADEAEIQPIRVISVEPAAGSAVVKWECPPMVTMSVEVIDGKRDAVGATFDRLVNQRSPVQLYPKRIGKARGNVKFSYMVLA